MSDAGCNTIALPIATMDASTLLEACSSNPDIACIALDNVVQAIEAAIRGVDDDFVALRTAMIRAAPDPRLVGLATDPRDPRDFYFNTWRHFGAETRWSIPGLLGEGGDDIGLTPDAIRRAQSEWNMGAGLILPGRNSSPRFEVLVTLDVDAMTVMCDDSKWNSFVDEIVE
jgi:hypothetical protein